jgi:hypothetical protein
MTILRIMKNKGILILLLASLLASCDINNDVEKAAEEYCECMRENGAPDKYPIAMRVCDARFIDKYYYYRVFMIDSRYIKDYPLPKSTLDSAMAFYSNIHSYESDNCCGITIFCDSVKK